MPQEVRIGLGLAQPIMILMKTKYYKSGLRPLKLGQY